MKSFWHVLLHLCAVTAITGFGQSATWYVDAGASGPGNGTQQAPFARIQSAINVASAGDSILVAPGVYSDYVPFTNYGDTTVLVDRSVQIRSTAGARATIIDGGGTLRCVLFFGSVTGAVLDGFTLRNGAPAVQGGGGVLCTPGAAPRIVDCIISGNTATDPTSGSGGGVRSMPFQGSVGVRIERCVFSGNSAAVWGGGLSLAGGVPDVRNCIFDSNTALAGGGVESTGVTATIRNCFFRNNAAAWGGAVVMSGLTAQTILNCTFNANTAVQGGAIGLWPALPGEPRIINSILWNDAPGEIATTSTLGTATPTVRFSNISGGWTGLGSSNISADPLFIDPVIGDLFLGSGSPCIDAGDSAAPGLLALDFESDPRIFGSSVDMGADEWTGGRLGILAGAGNIFTAVGDPVDVLTVNGGSGGGARRVDLALSQSFALSMAVPPSSSGLAPFAIFGVLGIPQTSDAMLLPGGIGTMAFVPCPVAPFLAPLVFTMVNTFGVDPCGALIPAGAAPWTASAIPGSPFPVDATIQGIIVDGGNGLKVTNGIIMSIR